VLIQRVLRAAVTIDGRECRRTGKGLAILVGVGKNDTEADAVWLADKTARLRVFANESGKLDLSLLDIKGEALVVSQFTLYGDATKGCRPDFGSAAAPEYARKIYGLYAGSLAAAGIPVKTGEFGAHMEVEILNDGPVTLMLERENGR